MLRFDVFQRSETGTRYGMRNRCENKIDSSRRCGEIIYWDTFHLHHILSRGRGGSDTAENTMALCPGCHFDHHHGVWPASRWDL